MTFILAGLWVCFWPRGTWSSKRHLCSGSRKRTFYGFSRFDPAVPWILFDVD